jgi:hypothetical protein
VTTKILLLAVVLMALQVRAAEPIDINLLGSDSEVRAALLKRMASHRDVEAGRRFLESAGFQCDIAKSSRLPFLQGLTHPHLQCERSISRIRELVVWYVALFPQSGPIVGIFVYPAHIYL